MSLLLHGEHFVDRAAMLAQRIATASQPPLGFAPAFRPAFDALLEQTPPAAGIAFAPGAVGGVAGWWCRPASVRARTAILYLHGGAYSVGSARAWRFLASHVAARALAPVFVADYRLAPEHPFPAAFDDAVAAWGGLGRAGFETLALAGDAAGGGLALALLELASAPGHDGVRPRCAAVMSPWTDLSVSGESVTTRAKADPVLKAVELGAAAVRYLAGAEPLDPRASPLWGEPRGLPPRLVLTGRDEILLDDSLRYAERGGDVELHVWDGMPHVFPASVTKLRAADEALALLGAFMTRHLPSDIAAPVLDDVVA